MLICIETPMELHVTPTWIPDEFILINSITAHTMGIHNDRPLKILLSFLLILHMLGRRLAHVKDCAKWSLLPVPIMKLTGSGSRLAQDSSCLCYLKNIQEEARAGETLLTWQTQIVFIWLKWCPLSKVLIDGLFKMLITLCLWANTSPRLTNKISLSNKNKKFKPANTRNDF